MYELGISSNFILLVPDSASMSTDIGQYWIIRGANGMALIMLMSREGVTQGGPMAMVAYGLMPLPLIVKLLKKDHPNVSQPCWYADDAGAGGSFTVIQKQFECLRKLGSARGYYPEPSKSILVVVRETNLVAAKAALRDLGF
jgi:hypothetical protein